MNPLNRTLIPAIIALSVSSALYAKKIKGYYIKYRSSEKIEATFIIPFGFLSSEPAYDRLQSSVKYIEGDNKYTLTPNDVSVISFTLNGEVIVLKSIYNTLVPFGDEQNFLKAEVEGDVSFYRYYESHYNAGSFNPGTGMSTGGGKQTIVRLVLQRGGDELVKIRRLYFKKDLLEFFADCPDLTTKINSSDVSDLKSIVMEYNAKCL